MAKARGLDYADYHRTIIGFHGTTVQIADRLVRGEPFRASANEDDWLGRGVYFWEYAPKQAWWWARRRTPGNAAVVGAMIRLGSCFDLLDSKNLQNLKNAHRAMIDTFEQGGIPIPTNERHHRDLDCAVFNYYYKEAADSGKPIDCARGVYVPTDAKKRLWRGSWLYEDAHIQICIRNTKNILAVWHIRPDGRYGQEAP